MKKVLVSLALLTILAVPVIGLAQPPVDAPDWYDVDVFETLATLSNYLFAILLIVAAIFIIVAAYMFVTAAGDPEKTKTARNFVLYALIGVLVAFAAKGLIMLVKEIAIG